MQPNEINLKGMQKEGNWSWLFMGYRR